MQTLLALLFLSLLIGLLFFYIASLYRRRGLYTLWESVLFSIAYVVCRGLWRVRVESLVPLPSEGGVIFVANHRSSIDPFLIQLAVGRRVHWMVAGEYCRHFLFGPILRVFQVIPTNRGGVDTASTKQAMRLLNEGRWIGMFPEGRINRTERPLLSIRPGAGLVASRANAQIVPIWIEGSPQAPTVYGPLLKAAQVTVRVGKAIPKPTDGASEQDVARHWVVQAMHEVCRLGNHREVQVEVAGKRWVDSA